MANVLNSKVSGISIDQSDDLPFTELVRSIPTEKSDIDVIIVTPGGTADQVSNFVDVLRPRFNNVAFLLPHIAMSAGTIFIMSGDEILMTPGAYFGPIDPQVVNRHNRYVPAQSLFTLIKYIQDRGDLALAQGQNPSWVDVLLVRELDSYDLGCAINASNYSKELVSKFLANYKFKSWVTHSSSGHPVTDEQRIARASEIAHDLCDHDKWKTHSRGINITTATNDLKLRVTGVSDVPQIERPMRRFWALMTWIFENTQICKIFISQEYSLFRVQQQVDGGIQ
jgi:hypothetical protein